MCKNLEGFRCSPQVRGCSYMQIVSRFPQIVFPAGAGVFPGSHQHERRRTGVPRRCGGVPVGTPSAFSPSPCSPQVRGCSCLQVSQLRCPGVFPAGAGVFLKDIPSVRLIFSVPRRCGGVPAYRRELHKVNKCSPQVRGCSHAATTPGPATTVFPAGAGVFPAFQLQVVRVIRVPRRCGGVPRNFNTYLLRCWCSPQVRGCSLRVAIDQFWVAVFPAGAGVFLLLDLEKILTIGVPRRCGGVPKANSAKVSRKSCSPQVRGCSQGAGSSRLHSRVFPAGAGVFPAGYRVLDPAIGVPRRCGGVPVAPQKRCLVISCSPQVRGCSLVDKRQHLQRRVFPAGAGVFPSVEIIGNIHDGVPRRCGGVPIPAQDNFIVVACSPQVRGCSFWWLLNDVVAVVFPAGAGVFLARSQFGQQ